LAIVKEVVERHGGVSRIDAPQGCGARIVVTFPPAAR